MIIGACLGLRGWLSASVRSNFVGCVFARVFSLESFFQVLALRNYLNLRITFGFVDSRLLQVGDDYEASRHETKIRLLLDSPKSNESDI